MCLFGTHVDRGKKELSRRGSAALGLQAHRSIIVDDFPPESGMPMKQPQTESWAVMESGRAGELGKGPEGEPPIQDTQKHQGPTLSSCQGA